jgi:hypothetical protein
LTFAVGSVACGVLAVTSISCGAAMSALDAGAGEAGVQQDSPAEPFETSTCAPCPVTDSGTDSGAIVDAHVDAPETEPCGSGLPMPSPALTHLAVTGLEMIPKFSPDMTDYYAYCPAAAGNALTFAAEAPAGAKVAVSIETPASPIGTVQSKAPAAASQSVSLSLQQNQAVVATVTAGSNSTQYWLRCLPTNPGLPPVMQWSTHDCTRKPGYYLIGFMALPVHDYGYGVVFDTNGVPVWYKSYGYTGVYDVETLLAGAISFSPNWQVNQLSDAGMTSTSVRMNSFEGGIPSTPDEHELRIVDSTHYLGFDSSREWFNLTGLTVPNGTGESVYEADASMYSCRVLEFNPTDGSTYWKWSATDHFDPVKAMVVKGNGDLGGSEAQPFHCNAIDVDPANGNLLVSSRNMSSIFYIEKKTGKVLWMMGGNKAAALDTPSPTFVNPDEPMVAQHDARLLPGWKETCSGGSGQISVFDDESYTSNAARGVIYDVVINDGSGCPGGTTGTTHATKSWEFKTWKNAPTAVCGGMRVTPDNTRVIGWGQSSPSPNGLVFTEADEKGNDMLDLVCPDHSSTFRAVKVSLSAFDLNQLRMTAGL